MVAAKTKGIIDPPIDNLLQKVDSKYQLVIFASKRARQINDYYADLHEGNLFDNVGPLVDSTVEDKPLTIALHEINDDKLRLRHVEESAWAEASGNCFARTQHSFEMLQPRDAMSDAPPRLNYNASPRPVEARTTTSEHNERAAPVHIGIGDRRPPRQDL